MAESSTIFTYKKKVVVLDVTAHKIHLSLLNTFNVVFVVAAPEYLTVSSTGPAGEKQASRMGDFRLTNEIHNNKPVWSSSNQKLYYNNRKFILWIMMMKMIVLLY